MTQKILWVLNPVAGGGRQAQEIAAVVQAMLRELNIVYQIVHTQQAGDGLALARQAVRDGYSHVVAAGGDGTVNEIATGLIGTGTVLGILPIGSGNGFARALKIPLEIEHACELLLHGREKAVDVGEVNERYFLATSGLGFDAHVGKRYNEHPGHSRGLLPYFQIAAAEYLSYSPQTTTLEYQGQTFTYTPFILTVANVNQYGGGAVIAPNALPDDGLLDIVVIPKIHALKMAYRLPRLFTGTLDLLPEVITHRAASLTIRRTSPGPLHVDGETFEAGEVLRYTLLPKALKVQVPKENDAPSTTGRQQSKGSENGLELLEKLASLKQKGVLTEEEFEQQKQKLLKRL